MAADPHEAISADNPILITPEQDKELDRKIDDQGFNTAQARIALGLLPLSRSLRVVYDSNPTETLPQPKPRKETSIVPKGQRLGDWNPYQ